MQEHTHTGPIMFLFAGISAIVFLNILRFLAAYLADKPGTEWLAKAIGGLITFSGDPAAVSN